MTRICHKLRNMVYKKDITSIISKMTTEEKIAQLFITTPESLAKTDKTLQSFQTELEQSITSVPIGGLLYYGRNLSNPKQTSEFLKKTLTCYLSRTGIPLFQCIDEESGIVSKVANNANFQVENAGSPFYIGKTYDTIQTERIGRYIGRYLFELGFNTDFAPCADILSNPRNQVIGERAFGNNPNIVSNMADAFAHGLLMENIIPTYKHFPGHGDTENDSHLGYAYTNKTLDELMNCEIIPFANGIKKDIPIIMVGHISLPHITGNHDPASLSKEIIDGLLRQQLGYDGIVITDSLKMKAISDNLSSKDAAIKAIEAGADLILRPLDFYEAYNGVICATKSGMILESRIDKSLRRILKVKEMISINN